MALPATVDNKVRKTTRCHIDFFRRCPESTIQHISEFLWPVGVSKTEDIERLRSMPILPPEIWFAPFEVDSQRGDLRSVLVDCLASHRSTFAVKRVIIQIRLGDRYLRAIPLLKVLVSFENLQLVVAKLRDESSSCYLDDIDRVVDVLKIARCKGVGLSVMCSNNLSFLKTLQGARKIPRLAKLHLIGFGGPYEGPPLEYEDDLRQLHTCESLKTLHISHYNLHGESYKGIVEAVRRSTTITSVTFSAVGEHGDILTQLVKQSTSLTSLKLFNCTEGSLALHDVAMALRTNTNLKKFAADAMVDDLSGVLAMLQMLRCNTRFRLFSLGVYISFNGNTPYVESILNELSEVMVRNKTLQRLELEIYTSATNVEELGFEDYFSTQVNKHNAFSICEVLQPGFLIRRKDTGIRPKMALYFRVFETVED